MNQIRDLVHTVKSSDLTPLQIFNAFGEIFLSADTMDNQLEAQEIVEMMRVVKVPTYGTHIPNTAKYEVTAGTSGLIKLVTVEQNKTYKILAASVDNAGNAVPVRFGLQDANNNFVAIFRNDVNAAGLTAFTDAPGVTFDSSMFPAAVIEAGDVNDFNFEIAYCEIVQ